MSPNSRNGTNNEVMIKSKTSKTFGSVVQKASTYVPIDRLYEIARQLAELELTNNEFIDTSVSLLDTNCDYNRIYESISHSNQDKNYCEVVSVPTSTHVAQIVGKQGAKIKLLRAKSQTYIQTPVTGEEPVFIITGRREDVLKVKTEILSASDHFTAVSEERKQKLRQNTDIPGSITLRLIIPSFLIGLIVGRNGNTIRNIQKMTGTYIETPKIAEHSAFKITGLNGNVEKAKESIIEHVMMKTSRNFKCEKLTSGDIKLNFDD